MFNYIRGKMRATSEPSRASGLLKMRQGQVRSRLGILARLILPSLRSLRILTMLLRDPLLLFESLLRLWRDSE